MSTGLGFTEVPIATRYFKEASSIGLVKSVLYGLGVLYTLGRYFLHKREHLSF